MDRLGLTPVCLERGGCDQKAESQVPVLRVNEHTVSNLHIEVSCSVKQAWLRREPTVSPQRIRMPRNTQGPLSFVFSAPKPHTRLVTIKIHPPIDSMAFDLSRSKPNDTTNNGEYEPMVWAGAIPRTVMQTWGSNRQFVSLDKVSFCMEIGTRGVS